MQSFWGTHFSVAGYKYGTEPNTFLTEQQHRFQPSGRVLVPGDGEGRNGVWLAQQRWPQSPSDAVHARLASD